MSYSQNEEEKYILEAVGSQVGTFLDIGAFDGKTFSNTLALIERGWSGVMVEPSPYAFASLVERHGTNEKISLVQAIVGGGPGIRPFWITRDALSTTEYERYELWKRVGNFKARVFVPQITISDVLNVQGIWNVDVVSIDTEGTSSILFSMWPFERCRPKVFCVECDNVGSQIEAIAKTENYSVVYRNDENMVLVRGN